MLSTINSKTDQLLDYFTRRNIHGPLLGLGRSLLALSLFLTLLVNDPHKMFQTGLTANFGEDLILFQRINFFTILHDHIVLAKWLACGLLLLIMSGWRPQITCIIHWYLGYSFLNTSLDIEGGDQICTNLALLLIPICLADNRKNHWQQPIQSLPLSQKDSIRRIISNSWFLLIKAQLTVVYFHSAVGKFAVPEWTNGTALYYWFNHPVFGMQQWLKPVIDPVIHNSYTAFYLSWAILLFELILSVSVLINPKYYFKLFIAALLFHFAIVFFHGLFSFFISMSGGLVLFYLIDYRFYKEGVKPIEEKIVVPNTYPDYEYETQ